MFDGVIVAPSMKPSPRTVLPLAALLLAGCGEPAPTPDASSDAAADAPRSDASTDAPVSDAGPGAAFTMAPGEVAEVPVAAGVAALRLATPTGAERFVLVLASTRFAELDAPATYNVLPRVDGFAPAPTLVTGCSLDESRWRATTLAPEAPPTGAAPAVGAERSFRVPIADDAGAPEVLTARVAAVSERAVVWADVTPSHPATLDMTFVAGLLRVFDATILPRERAVFGTESDVDGDGRVALVFSPLLAQNNHQAFFWQCDLLGMPGCSGPGGSESNRVEAVYLAPPDMLSPPYNTPAAVNEIVAHEVGHVIHFGRKVLRNRLTSWSDSVAMIEGFGGFAQDVIGFQLDGLRATKVALDQVDRFSMADVLADGADYDPVRKASLRGGAYLFVRWLYDRAGGDEAPADGTIAHRGGPALLRALLDAPTSVASSLRAVAGLNSADVAMDFYTALAASNRESGGGVAAANACFRYGAVATDPVTARPRGADLYSTFEGVMARGPATQMAATADGSLRHGGVEYLQVDATAGAAELAVTVRADAPAAARVRVLRVR